MSARFGWYELRTTDRDAGASFYAAVAGWRLDERDLDASGGIVLLRDARPMASVNLLPEAARARGAPAHWLGHILVDDVDATLRRFVAAGGQPLGPVRALGETRVAMLRDGAGAVLALASGRGVAGRSSAVAWHELHSPDPARSFATYADLFGWEARETIDLGPPMGRYQTFAAGPGEPLLGAMASNANRPEVHAQWVLYLDVADLDAAVATARARGGRLAHEPMALSGPPGGRVVYLEDPQGAAIGLRGP